MINEKSYGTIPVFRDDTGIKVLLIHMYGSGGGTHWAFPKGRPESREIPEETAVRETKEEVGLNVKLVAGIPAFSHEYRFERGGQMINKKTTYFLATTTDQTVTPQESEILESKWCTPEEALELITYDAEKDLFRGALVYIEK